MNKQFIPALALLVACGSAQADFNLQVDGYFGGVEIDTDYTDIETENTGISAIYYLDSVSIDGKPIREAAFMGRQSKIGIGYMQDEITKPSYADFKSELYGVAADIRIGESPFRVGGGYGRHTNGDYDGDVFDLTFGWHVAELGLLSFTYSNESGDYGRVDVDQDLFSVGYKQIIKLNNSHLSVGGGASVGSVEEGLDDDDLSQVNGFVKWYVTEKFGFGGQLIVDSVDGRYEDITTVQFVANASYDFNELIGVSVELGRGDINYDETGYEEIEEDLFSYKLAAQVRF
ncbi:hypothetical protein SIN8267_00440 [Sinobacterium norvegicum]|uniref:Porin n=1 Tax=Sinobacterium norvegicum TaxID=1641715 RepID=A0ABN8ECZ4_9GAMM|nr:hypothetical protein [Sinobacterium norvegicum]CAH0990348.1 hypothetical protein SIN8267_00440 [Sinobacterium norvegicum]